MAASEYGLEWNDTALLVRNDTGKSVHFLFDGGIELRDRVFPETRWIVRWSPQMHRWTIEPVEGH